MNYEYKDLYQLLDDAAGKDNNGMYVTQVHLKVSPLVFKQIKNEVRTKSSGFAIRHDSLDHDEEVFLVGPNSRNFHIEKSKPGYLVNCSPSYYDKIVKSRKETDHLFKLVEKVMNVNWRVDYTLEGDEVSIKEI